MLKNQKNKGMKDIKIKDSTVILTVLILWAIGILINIYGLLL
ncbi:hypothetical protein Phi46:3_gp042 [Cellulophaga phage phi46:3]|uniref:Uncharacterized protein n=1 Tax=Cellulophaga phage phi46:3 TaxID=1327985 RepID=S0A088_9CAUD|nr:hypothetical protein Phi46:3_gp042 [Cellulophaga phage phi46:3]AGO48786.1 hypothetical protein Phi46:3_gp042 [Cellulophaga phage phi46:3]